ncbi:phospho-N-acetylmuramoyl-pentapeptide-transferase [Tissierella carlieri]|jgi:phospho-N-acetylmuramoyl-pentapeptide-transferase|uniref:Phospho-N-acetylmuramoyl-pentapeptide-transferase n=1 Tax=Tissierella carlieri TaxID=689904 RepID=A0ABT1SBI6_9FIRM|nr:phospho-N-acetylmuramoyl-pentapeptide-transferase [Tissierella carlieri]MBU5313527.1 phospho-N-acetylmuramoyl-pentapeptide-transferase [Tissierella carlieri]MCQ4923847.1 phospho-N-acetylmuramoyl-pentapeptide-transferase [Tissierella carlieri]MDU5082322.1 phospho-N-acetylmuramoyl-pentapeptide-transferase [Bacillota bacterium]
MIEYIDIFRTISISFLITLILGPIMIPLLRRLKIGQSVRDDGPQTHLKKSGTPTMGGIIIFIALVITVLTSGMMNKDMYILLISTFGFGLIGFIDDYIKVVKRRSLGLRAYQKLIGQVMLATVLAVYQSSTSILGTKLIVPFLNNQYLDLGPLYIPFIAFVVVATVNAVNLTDGLDGLASGVTLIILSFFGLIALNWGMGSISIFSTALAGACLGFLIHNAHPAKVFMGDTGSLALGGAVAAIAILLNIPLVIPIVGGVYFIETLSVIIQVASFKLTGKRVFLMAPLHHHYEQKGWKETKVVAVFWTATVILCLIGILSLI